MTHTAEENSVKKAKKLRYKFVSGQKLTSNTLRMRVLKFYSGLTRCTILTYFNPYLPDKKARTVLGNRIIAC